MSDSVESLLVTGVYGSGKSSVIEEMGSMFEERSTPYAALDLDWLGWFDAGWDDDRAEHAMMVRNLDMVLGNYLDAGVRRVIMALSIEHQWELDAIKAVSPQPFHVVRLVTDLDHIRARLEATPTAGRQVDLKWAEKWLAAGTGEGFEDFVVANDRPIRVVAEEVLDRVDWT
jgi:hypothetical protein